ncbi:MAG: apolipoprotein N-acyltransferase [Verrucomicrobia bacterium]|nr:apolipoprotein N-acyltransferase [Verrucomicrobiota bacterium]
MDLCRFDRIGADLWICPLQSASGRMARFDPSGLLWREGEAGFPAKLRAGLVCGCDPFFDDFQLADLRHRGGLVRPVSVHRDLPRTLVCPVGSVCRWRCGENDECREYSACVSRGLSLGPNRVASGDRFQRIWLERVGGIPRKPSSFGADCRFGRSSGMTMVYGARSVLHPNEKAVHTLNYAAIQPAVPQDPWRSAKMAQVAEQLVHWSEIALTGNGAMDLLVWPESLAGTGWREEPEFQRAVQKVRRGGARSLLTGSLDIRGAETFNSAVLFTGEEGCAPQVYDKNHLVIMGEYVPLAGIFPWLRKLVPPGGDLTAGESVGILELAGSKVKIAPLICFEDSVARVVRRAAQKLPHLLVNLTNDAWFGSSAGAKQHLENARFRAIETRLPLLRATNDGVTVLISPRGVILAEVWDPETQSYRLPGFLRGEIELVEPTASVYTKWGDWPVWASMGLVLAGLIRFRDVT